MKILMFNQIKITLSIFIIALIIPCSLFAQQQKEERVSINVKNATVKDFINRLGKLTKLEFVYASDDLSNKRRITYRADSTPLVKVLDETLKPLGLNFKVDKGVISIFQRQVTDAPASSVPTSSTKGTRYLSGQVLDAKTGMPLKGATISTPSQKMTISGSDGTFSLPVDQEDGSMSASFVGYSPSEISIAGKSAVSIYLTPSTANLEDVVVTGMFTRKQSTYTGAVHTLKAEDLERTGTLNVIEAISRLDPSFQILINDQMGSNPNALPDIQMRGAGSFPDMKARYTSSPNQPLFILDGFEQPLERVFDMDMNRIKTITLLKDATAKAIYGSKGANGVVVIETKRPVMGRLRVSYKADLNIQAPVLSDYNLTDAAQKLEIERLAGMYSSPYPDQQLALDQQYQAIHHDILKGVNTDWLAQPTRVGFGQKHSINLEGGDDKILYNINVSYNNIEGVMKGSARRTIEGGFGLQYRYRNFVFREQLSIVSNQANESPYGSFEDYARMNPYWRVKDDRGNLISMLGVYDRYHATDIDGDGIPDQKFSIYNPMLNANTNYLNQKKYLDVTNNFFVEWNPVKDLRITGRFGLTDRASKGDLFYPSSYATLDPGSPINFRGVKPDAANDAYYKRGEYTISNESTFSLSSNIGISYSKTIRKLWATKAGVLSLICCRQVPLIWGALCLGGVIFNLANILLTAAIAIAGLSVAFPIGIGIALILGVIVNYMAVQKGDATMLFLGVILVAIAIILNAVAYRKKSGVVKKAGTKGIVLSVLAGILMSFFYRFIAASMDLNNFEYPEIEKMTPYTAFVIFAIGIFISNLVFNTVIMKKPLEGPALSYGDYFKGKFSLHLVGIAGGIIWGIGNLFNLIAAEKAGPAISYGLGQGATLIAAIWGVAVWKEFKHSGKQVSMLLAGMFLFFVVGLALIIYAGT